MFRIISCLAIIVLSGCSSQIPNETLIKQNTELATVITLQEAQAELSEANRVAAMAISIKEMLLEEKEIDYNQLKIEILGQITNSFDPPLNLTLAILANNIATIIIDSLETEGVGIFNKESTFTQYLTSAAEGVESGVNIYIASKISTGIMGPPIRPETIPLE